MIYRRLEATNRLFIILLFICFSFSSSSSSSSSSSTDNNNTSNKQFVYINKKSVSSDESTAKNVNSYYTTTQHLINESYYNKSFDPLWYLNKFGYLDMTKKVGNEADLTTKMSSSLLMMPKLDDESHLLADAVKRFQKYAGLPVTGQLDNQTLAVMKLPRCGHPDILKSKKSGGSKERFTLDNLFSYRQHKYLKARARRRKRYALQGSKWAKSKLKFKVGKYPMYSMLSKEQIDHELKRAFNLWSEASNVEFEQVNDAQKSKSLLLLDQIVTSQTKPDAPAKKVDIDVRFETGFHGDSEPFDGSGLILGHAYFPEFGGSTHFDADELWTSKSNDGVNLYQVAVHEFGHALGLEHSDNFDAIMAPFFR